ncbi:MAG: H-NS histone family protein [Candidatus Electrothrix sp. GM3_4]|nr:H-NS histone family protein [Candidatus Electrothrix sp. GM3_4]
MLKTIANKPLEELIKLRDDLDKLIKKRQREQKKELKKQFKAMAKEQGLSIDEILTPNSSPNAPKKGGKVPIKYKKGGDTWAGRGRNPAWVNDLIKKGGKLEDYLVEEELVLDLAGEDLEGQETKNG